MFSRVGRLTILAAIFIVVGALGGCAESKQPIATGKGKIRGVNSLVGAPEMTFKIEERGLGTIGYKSATAFESWDNLQYKFNFDMILPEATAATRVATRGLKVDIDKQYTIVLTGSVDDPGTVVWEDDVRSWMDSDTVLEVTFAHLAPTVGNIDVYFAPTGTPPMLGQQVGTLSKNQRLEPRDFEEGEFELIITRRDKPAEILFQSDPQTTVARSRVLIAVFDPDPTITTDFAVTLINEGGIGLAIPDVDARGQVRLFHAAFEIENVDGYLDEDLLDIAYPDIEFAEISAYADVESLTSTLTVTPVGNVGSIIHEDEIIVGPTSKRTAFLVGTLANPLYLLVLNDGRPLDTFPIVRIINLSVNQPLVNVFLTDPDEQVEDVLIPTIPLLPSPIATSYFGTKEGPQVVTITAFGDSNPLATPVDIDLSIGDVIDVLILDTVDPDVLEAVILTGQ